MHTQSFVPVRWPVPLVEQRGLARSDPSRRPQSRSLWGMRRHVPESAGVAAPPHPASSAPRLACFRCGYGPSLVLSLIAEVAGQSLTYLSALVYTGVAGRGGQQVPQRPAGQCTPSSQPALPSTAEPWSSMIDLLQQGGMSRCAYPQSVLPTSQAARG